MASGGGEGDEQAVRCLDAAAFLLQMAFEDKHWFGGGQLEGAGVLADGGAVVAGGLNGCPVLVVPGDEACPVGGSPDGWVERERFGIETAEAGANASGAGLARS